MYNPATRRSRSITRTLINCRWQNHEHLTGVQRYSSDLVEALLDHGLEFDRVAPLRGPTWKQALWEQRTLPRLASEYSALLCPANMAPARLPKSVRLVLTIHCLRFRAHPESYSRRFAAWYRFMMPRVIERADTVLTVSESISDEIQNVYPNARGKVRVVHPGVSGLFGVEGHRGDRSIPLSTGRGTGGYWVFVGNATRAKNLGLLLRAMEMTRHPHRLVLLGVSRSQLAAMAREGLPMNDRVIPVGHVNDTGRVAAILRGAAGLLAPSRYESFDLPTAEAMASGIPVLASDTAVHREVCGEAAVYLSPCSPEVWAAQMDRITDEPGEAQRMIEMGIERAARYRWDTAAAQIAKILSPTGENNS